MLELKSITKLYSRRDGIRNVSINISHGQIVAFVGPNGSGKSTLFNTIGQVQKADFGNCSMDGIELKDMNISEVGFLPENSYLINEFTPLQMLYFINTMKGIDASEEDISELINRFSIHAFTHKKIKALSQGMRKRVSLACAVLGNPKLLILDEPLNYLDIDSVFAFKEILKRHKERGCIVLLSGHILESIDAMADQVVFLKQGEIIKICSDINEPTEKLYREYFRDSSDFKK